VSRGHLPGRLVRPGGSDQQSAGSGCHRDRSQGLVAGARHLSRAGRGGLGPGRSGVEGGKGEHGEKDRQRREDIPRGLPDRIVPKLSPSRRTASQHETSLPIIMNRLSESVLPVFDGRGSAM
jgi:hypothetical protein